MHERSQDALLLAGYIGELIFSSPVIFPSKREISLSQSFADQSLYFMHFETKPSSKSLGVETLR